MFTKAIFQSASKAIIIMPPSESVWTGGGLLSCHATVPCLEAQNLGTPSAACHHYKTPAALLQGAADLSLRALGASILFQSQSMPLPHGRHLSVLNGGGGISLKMKQFHGNSYSQLSTALFPFCLCRELVPTGRAMST